MGKVTVKIQRNTAPGIIQLTQKSVSMPNHDILCANTMLIWISTKGFFYSIQFPTTETLIFSTL